MNAVEVRGLSKLYRIGGNQGMDYKTVRDAFSAFFRKKSKEELPQTFWALRDVSFDVKEGEAVGIIGKNGAGKSTLLKILSRITEPTSGIARLHGRVASLLEVGTGFHPELSGRENIYLNGAILGMSRLEVKTKFDAIVEFAEIAAFLDTPVKRYSSGMYVRLAFAVAAHLDPEILIVDEVLAVGDIGFQRKCLERMGEESREGRTVLFVSHNMQAVKNICKRAVVLDQGSVSIVGESSVVIDGYLELLTKNGSQGARDDRMARIEGAHGGGVRLHSVEIITDGTNAGGIVSTSQEVHVVVDFTSEVTERTLMVTFIPYSVDGFELFDTDSETDDRSRGRLYSAGRFRAECIIPPNLLNEGTFAIRVLITDKNTLTTLVDCRDAAQLIVHDLTERPYQWHGRYKGFVHPLLPWTVDVVDSESMQREAEGTASLECRES